MGSHTNPLLFAVAKSKNSRSGFCPAVLAAAIATSFGLAAAESEGAFDGETLVVSGSRIEQKLEDVAGSVTVVTAQDIEQLMMTSLERLFRYEPGISTTGNGAQPQTITVRGVGGNRLVYIKDGRRSNDGYAGGGGFIVGRGYLDTSTVAQVEVAKGAASSLYGSDGLGGIVVITTKDPEDYLRGDDRYLAVSIDHQGTADELGFDVAGAMNTGKWAFSGALSQRDGHEVQNFTNSLPGYDANSQAALIKAVYAVDSHQSVKLTLDHFQQELEQVITADINETVDDDRNTAFSVDYHNSAKTGLWDTLDAQLYYSQYEQNSDQVRFSTRGYTDFNDYQFQQDIVGVRLVLSKHFAGANLSHALVYGLDYDQYDTTRPRWKTRQLADGSIDFSRQAQAAFPGAETVLAGLFVQDNIALPQLNLSLVLGGRLDFYDMKPKEDALYDSSNIVAIDETAFSPKVGLIYNVSDALTVYGQYVAGFKIQPHDQAYQSHGVEPFYQILPNSDLEAEESQTIELGIRYHNNALSIELSGYHSDFEHFIESTLVGMEDTFIPGVTKQLFQYQNLDNTTIKGLEASASWGVADNWELSANMAWAKGENEDTGQPLTSISPLQGNLLIKTQWQDWDFTGALRFARSMTDVPVDAQGQKLIQSSGYGVVDVYGQYQGDNWQLRIGVENLLDKEYVPYESIAGQPAGSDIAQYTQASRALNLNLAYQF